MTSSKRPIIKTLSAILLATLWTHSAIAAESNGPSIKPFGFAQFTGTFGSGDKNKSYDFDRVRLGVKGEIDEKIDYVLLLELMKMNAAKKANTTVGGIQDAKMSYTFSPEFKLTAGQFKTPFSMEFNTAATKLDVINFGMAGNVMLNRAIGFMASGRNITGSGLSYDLGMFNAGSRGAATAYNTGTLGKDDLFSGRILFDGMNKMLHVEVGQANETVKGADTYAATYAGTRIDLEVAKVSAEWLRGKQGTRTTKVYYGQLLVPVTNQIEAVAKWEKTAYADGATKLNATNLIVGFNAAIYPNDPKRARLQFNFISTGKDSKSIGVPGSPVGFKKGYTDNQAKLLLQTAF
jgi:hypothetical protein